MLLRVFVKIRPMRFFTVIQKGHGKDPMGNSPPCNLDENRCIYRSLHAEQKSPCPQSRRTNLLTYRGHQRSNLQFLPVPLVTSVGQTVGPTTSGHRDFCSACKHL